ncbi:Fanconi anemia group A protein isoform X2 [Pseudophryne corroboree]|uniref:Fanconi anemia group A protein isoform X2 n=1 Tax=Pseudophryne corroboree TaxID=495146 RepID=UPI0030817CA5
MSAVSGSSTRGQKRSLADLLANRPKKPDGKPECSSNRLQEAALYLLSCHQDVNQFLFEAEGPSCKKLSNGESSDPRRPLKHTPLTEEFIGATLRDQALHLGFPPNILGARAAVSNIQQICQSSAESTQGEVLSQDQRDRLTGLLKTLRGLLSENCFSHSFFLKEIWEQERPPVLEVIWHLQNMDIVGLEDLLESCRAPRRAVEWFCSETRSLFLHMEKSSADLEFLERVISTLLTALIGRAFCPSATSGKTSEHSKMIDISRSILDKMLSWLLDSFSEATNDQSYKPGAERHWLIAYKAAQYRARLIPESLEGFFVHTLTQTLTYKPKLKASDAIRFQGTWSFVKTCPLLTDLYRRLFVLLSPEKLTSHIEKVLDTQEVNWHHVLTCVSCLVICQSEAQRLVKDLLGRLLSQAFESYELEYLITAFLIARQAALEGPAAFVSYMEWFKCTFGAASSHQGATKKSLVFLLKFLSDLVPYESPQYLKVHILHPPFVPTKFRPLLMEYITLAKTRLADMKVSIEDMGLYEDLSAGSEKDQTQSQAQHDVEKAVRIYENTGKIPASVMEASIFRRPYFTSRFLHALLAPRLLPEVPDSHMLLIDALKRADKIPAAMLNAYLDACELEKHRKLEGNEKMDVSMNEEPMARLQSALWELRSFVTDAKGYDEVSSQVAVISDRLASVMGSSDADVFPVTSGPLFSETAERLEPLELMVADLLLTSFCQCIMAASSTNQPDRQGPWPTLYVKMLCGHRRALFVVLSRTVQLLCHQAPHLKDPHVVGLAALAVHLHECRTSLASPSTNVYSLEKFWEVLLTPRCSDSVCLVLRFCTAAISYACSRFMLLSPGTSADSVPPIFMRKLQHLSPRLIRETREEVMSEDEVDTPYVFRSLRLLSTGWKDAGITLWRQSRLQQVLRQQPFQLSLTDWLLWEMALSPDRDPLCDTERQEYQRWALGYCYLPEFSAADGCGSDLETACSVVVDSVLQFCCKPELSVGSSSRSRTGLSDILCRLQELVCDWMMSNSRSGKVSCLSFLLKVFYRRLEPLTDNMDMSARLRIQGELTTCCRILLGLPSTLLVSRYSDRGDTTLSCEDFFTFVNNALKNMGHRGYALPYDITTHFFRGVLGSSALCKDPSEAVNSIFTATYSLCPVILTSAAIWWPQLEPVIRSQWKHLRGGDLPMEIETLRTIQADVDSCLSEGISLPVTGTVWLSAAFLHVTRWRRKASHGKIVESLASLSKQSVQLLDSLLFLSVLDLIPVILKGTSAERKGTVESCLQIIHCMDERGGNWVTAFQISKDTRSTTNILHQTASDQFLSLLPLAFFSLAPSLPLESVVKQHNFLSVALKMYDQLIQLFLDGSPLADPLQMDSHDLFSSGRRLLLRCIVKSPQPSTALRNQLPQIADSWEEKDPELAVLLRNFLQPSHDNDLYDEPDLF